VTYAWRTILVWLCSVSVGVFVFRLAFQFSISAKIDAVTITTAHSKPKLISTSVARSPNRMTIDGKPDVIPNTNPSNHFTTVVDKLSQCTDTATSGFTIFIIPTPTDIRILSDIVMLNSG